MAHVKVGVLSFPDSHKVGIQRLLSNMLAISRGVSKTLQDAGEVEPINGQQTIWPSGPAQTEVRRLASEGVKSPSLILPLGAYRISRSLRHSSRQDRSFFSLTSIPSTRGCRPQQGYWTKSASFVGVDKGTNFLKEGLKS